MGFVVAVEQDPTGGFCQDVDSVDMAALAAGPARAPVLATPDACSTASLLGNTVVAMAVQHSMMGVST